MSIRVAIESEVPTSPFDGEIRRFPDEYTLQFFVEDQVTYQDFQNVREVQTSQGLLKKPLAHEHSVDRRNDVSKVTLCFRDLVKKT